MVHRMKESLKKSHEASDLPFWGQAYKAAFPDMRAMVDHRQDGWHQRAGVDRSIVFESSKQILVDEKVRFKEYDDILLEYYSNEQKKVPGWAVKPLLADYIAYAFVTSGKCYLLPVVQMQSALQKNKEVWWYNCVHVRAENEGYTTASLAVKTVDLLNAIRDMFCVSFEPMRGPNA